MSSLKNKYIMCIFLSIVFNQEIQLVNYRFKEVMPRMRQLLLHGSLMSLGKDCRLLSYLRPWVPSSLTGDLVNE